MPGKNYSRAERETMIIQTLALKVQKRLKPECTVAGMARSLGLEPSTHLRNIMNAMVEDERLNCEIKPHRKGWEKRVYSLPPGSYQEPRARQIALKINGVKSGQLELW